MSLITQNGGDRPSSLHTRRWRLKCLKYTCHVWKVYMDSYMAYYKLCFVTYQNLCQARLQEIDLIHIPANHTSCMAFGLEWRALANHMVTALGSCVKWPSFTVFPFGPFGLDLEPWRYVFGKTKGLSVKCCHISNQKVYTLLRYKIPHKQVPTFLKWLPVTWKKIVLWENIQSGKSPWLASFLM